MRTTERLLFLLFATAIVMFIGYMVALIYVTTSGVRTCNDKGGLYDHSVPACYAPDGRRL